MSERGGYENSGDDWKVGDWAECVESGWSLPMPHNPNVGDRLIVSAVTTEFIRRAGREIVFLCFVGKPREDCWSANCFRKIISDKEDRKVERRADRPVGEPVA